jgi:hypothetical protein
MSTEKKGPQEQRLEMSWPASTELQTLSGIGFWIIVVPER